MNESVILSLILILGVSLLRGFSVLCGEKIIDCFNNKMLLGGRELRVDRQRQGFAGRPL